MDEFGLGYEAPDVERVHKGPPLAKVPDIHTRPPSELAIWFYNAFDRAREFIFPRKTTAQIFASSVKPPKKAPYIDQAMPEDTECFGLPKPK